MAEEFDQLKAQIEALTTLVTEMANARKAEAEKYELRLKDEAKKNSRKLQTKGERLNAAQGFSIHVENKFIPRNIKDELPDKLALVTCQFSRAMIALLLTSGPSRAIWASRASTHNTGLCSFHTLWPP
ncbi:hypothetical protein vseg_016159 [Gypsophila vaccaria]